MTRAAVWRAQDGTVVALGPVELRPTLSPCRRDPRKGSRGHHCSRQHAELVQSYRDARDAQEQRADAASQGYASELAGFYGDPGQSRADRTETKITFGAWLTSWRHDAGEQWA